MRWTTRDIRQMKGRDKIPVLTCYDHATARLLDQAGIPILLVGDSLGNVVLGYDTTVPVTVEEMIHHARAVMRAKPRAFVIVDMPFLSYQISPERALESAGRIVKESGADAVKLEGGRRVVEAVKRIVESGIPVCGHLGLTPQSVLALGGYPLQGKGDDGDRLLEEASELEAAGCFALVLEKVPAELAERVTAALSIPTIGIGAGSQCDGQVLVVNDLLGLDPSFHPRFVKRYADVGRIISEAAARYAQEVRSGTFPAKEHAYHDRAAPRSRRARFDSADPGARPAPAPPESEPKRAGEGERSPGAPDAAHLTRDPNP
jgi:3-methyl-2-oxobutanoate hydroxymethyltransferase